MFKNKIKIKYISQNAIIKYKKEHKNKSQQTTRQEEIQEERFNMKKGKRLKKN